jgi:hypothetical protein
VYTPDGAVFGAGDDERQGGVEAGDRHVVGVALQGLHAGLVLVVPHLEQPVAQEEEENNESGVCM